ncbi:IS110 family transposase [Mucilaginibacter terrae]|uniref:IS110 family transposase n=1 Tax=Mucilaginibacter terrae TaxID=1955052 RepID=UPI00363BBA7D
MTEQKEKQFTYFIGIDVSRNELDFALQHGNKLLYHKEIGNNVAEITAFLVEFKKTARYAIAKAVFGMENTGIYSNHLLTVLRRHKANIVHENPLHIKNSLGNIRGKYDKIDAIRIAQYLFKSRDNLRLWLPKRPIIQQLAHLSTLRARLLTLKGALATPLKEDTTFVDKKILSQSKKLCELSISAMTSDLVAMDNYIAELIKSDTRINHLHNTITSIPSVGTVTAVQILITTNEFIDITNPKKYACYAGVAPFKKESGLITANARVSHIANKKVKALLHTCALGSVRYVPEMKAYYERKVAEGKPKMAVLNAVRNKLVLKIFACVKQDVFYDPDYKREPLEDIDILESTTTAN